MNIDPLKQAEDVVKQMHAKVEQSGRSVFSRYPILFSILPAFGAAFVFYSFERFAESTPILFDNPLLIFVIGISILFTTGSLYKRLGE